MATRFYLPSTGASAVSPTFDPVWDVDGQAGARRAAVRTRISSAMASVTIVDEFASGTQRYLMRQYVTEGLPAQTISGTFKGQIRVSADDPAWNRVSLSVRAVSNDGSTFAGSDIVALNEFYANANFSASLTNRRIADGDGLSNVIAINEGDRLVIEVGVRTSAASFESIVNANFGDDSSTDLAEDESTTAADNPWIEFSANLFDRTLTPSAVNGAGAVPTPTVVVGGVTLTPAAVNGLGEVGNPDHTHVARPAVDGVGEVPIPVIEVGLYQPVTATAQVVDNEGPVGMRIYPTSPASLSDLSTLSGSGVSHIIGPGSGSTTILGTSITGAAGGSGVITHIIIQGDVWIDDTVPAPNSYVPHTAHFFHVKIPSVAAATYGTVSGIIPAAPNGRSHWNSGPLTDRPGGGAWTWANLQGLEELGITASYTLGTNEYSVLSLQEIWIEVYGPQGSNIPALAVKARTGPIIFNAAIDPQVG